MAKAIDHGVAAVLVFGGLNSLAAGLITWSSTEIDFGTSGAADAHVELAIDAGTTSGNKQVIVYARSAVDSTNYSDGTNRENMAILGTVYLPDSNPVRSLAMSVAAAFGGYPPAKVLIGVYNDSGAALAAAGNSGQYRTIIAP